MRKFYHLFYYVAKKISKNYRAKPGTSTKINLFNLSLDFLNQTSEVSEQQDIIHNMSITHNYKRAANRLKWFIKYFWVEWVILKAFYDVYCIYLYYYKWEFELLLATKRKQNHFDCFAYCINGIFVIFSIFLRVIQISLET